MELNTLTHTGNKLATAIVDVAALKEIVSNQRISLDYWKGQCKERDAKIAENWHIVELQHGELAECYETIASQRAEIERLREVLKGAKITLENIEGWIDDETRKKVRGLRPDYYGACSSIWSELGTPLFLVRKALEQE